MKQSKRNPNVILVMTDDQGYGDLACTGNPWIQTPNIDAFYNESVRFTDFHVSPLCTPTRGALMTGHRPTRNGAWATCWGRSILRKTEVTMADVFAANGYRTGMFGKWHLGDNYPYRPHDRGFDHVVAHRGGGVGQTPDFWGNNYFDDTYFHNNEPQEHTGYCTDIWFEEAMKFITGLDNLTPRPPLQSFREGENAPFFAYIATNAPHWPYLVAERYKALYRDNAEIPEPAFYGMITNIDENMGRLVQFLDDHDLADDTILIFMTDNGSSGGWTSDGRGYNAGMRGKKGSYYDGGHRVPFFIRWPGGGIQGGKDVDAMVLHVDLLPTLIDLCGLEAPDTLHFDGVSVAGLLDGSQQTLPDRVHFVQYRQDTVPPKKWENAVMTPQWRLIHGRELYDIKADPGQQHDVAAQYPEVVAHLRAAHEAWWAEISPRLGDYCPISLGNDAENPTRLVAFDVLGDVAWHQGHILLAKRSTGRWVVDVEQPGTYRVSLRRWPEELDLPLDAEVAREEAARIPYVDMPTSVRIQPTHARLELFDQVVTMPVAPGAKEVTFHLQITQTGMTHLEAWFVNGETDDPHEQGAYYVYVERLDSG